MTKQKFLRKVVVAIMSCIIINGTCIPVSASFESSEKSKTYNIEDLQKLYDEVTIEQDYGISLFAEDGYISTLSMKSNSWHSGATRDYNNSNFKCTFTNLTALQIADNSGVTKCDLDVMVGTSNIFNFNELASSTVTFTSAVSTKTTYPGNAGSGKRAFAFRTHASGVECDDVAMRSY